MSGKQRTSSLLDGETYHVFRWGDRCILYDVRTGVVAEVNDAFTFDLLKLAASNDLDTVVSMLDRRFGNVDAERVLSSVRPFLESGLFEHEDREPHAAEGIRDLLLKHRPRRIQLFVAQACNMACVYCYARENQSNDRNLLMTFDVAKEAVDYLVERSGGRRGLGIQFFGGEPLLNFEVMRQVVDYTKELEKKTDKHFSYQVSTNGTLLTEEIEDYIVQHDMGTLVSLDGDRETHDRQRPLLGGGPSFDLILGKARRLNEKFKRRGRKTLKIRANLVSKNIQPFQVCKVLEDKGFTFVGISGIFARPGEETEFSFTADDNRQWREQSDAMFDMWLEAIDGGEKPPSQYAHDQVAKAVSSLASRARLGMIRCGVGRNTNAVDVDGNIFPCHRYVGMDNYIIGNVKAGLDWDKVGRYYDTLIGNSLNYCSACWMRALCGGPCPWEISKTDGEIMLPSPDACDQIKRGGERALYLYVRLAEQHPELLRKMMGGRTMIILGQEGIDEEVADAEEKDPLVD